MKVKVLQKIYLNLEKPWKKKKKDNVFVGAKPRNAKIICLNDIYI